MPLLDRNGYRDDAWTSVEGAAIEGVAHAIVTQENLAEAAGRTNAAHQFGVEVANNAEIAEIEPFFDRLALIAIRFPAFSDGRGFSLARRLRRAGFKGTLRVKGPIIADQWPYAISCGFDEVELPEASAQRQPGEQWLKAIAAMSFVYQRGYGGAASILDQRRAARAAGGSHGA